MEIIVIILLLILTAIALTIVDWYCSIKCPQCGCKMTRRFNVDEDCEEFICPVCGNKNKIYG